MKNPSRERSPPDHAPAESTLHKIKTMPLRAITKDGKSCYSFEFPSRAEFEASDRVQGGLFCPITQTECFIRYRFGVVPHFVRKKDAAITFDYHPESIGHQNLKRYVYDYFRLNTLRQTPSLFVALEVPLPNIGKNGRIADVAILDRDTKEVQSVVECQLSLITPYELEERTDDYEQAGITCLWILGDSAAHSPQLVAKCEELFGLAITCGFTTKKTTIAEMFDAIVSQRQDL